MNAQQTEYLVVPGKPTKEMPRLTRAGYVLVNPADLLAARIDGEFREVDIVIGAMIIGPYNGLVKVVYDAPQLKTLTPKILLVDGGLDLTDKFGEFGDEAVAIDRFILGRPLKEGEVDNPELSLWPTLMRDLSCPEFRLAKLWAAYQNLMFNVAYFSGEGTSLGGYNLKEAMGVYLPEDRNDRAIGRILRIESCGKGSSARVVNLDDASGCLVMKKAEPANRHCPESL